MQCRSRDRSRSPRKAARATETCCVLEASKDAHRWAAYECHFAKTTFRSEASQVRTRVIASHGQCRTFILCEKGQVPKNILKAKDRKELVLAAMTVRMNPYAKFAKMWAQVLHMSAWEERQGHGSKLVTAVEELLRQEGVDVIVSYPAPTQQAESFWKKMGYVSQDPSLLPDEELIPRWRGGPLWPEQSLSGEALEQWEKRLSVGALQPREEAIRTRPGGDGRRYRELVWRPKDLRKRQASEVIMSAEELQKLMAAPSAPVRRRMRGKQPSLVVGGSTAQLP